MEFHIHVTLLREVSILGPGKSFGELALITDKPRMATIYTIDRTLILATLKKSDYIKYIGDTFKQKIDKALEIVQRFDIFKCLSQKKLTSIYYYFKEKSFIRH